MRQWTRKRIKKRSTPYTLRRFMVSLPKRRFRIKSTTLLLVFALLFLSAPSPLLVHAQPGNRPDTKGKKLTPNVESAETPEVDSRVADRDARVVDVEQVNTSSPMMSISRAAAVQEPQYGPNLVTNPNLETTGSNGNPEGWKKGGYGTNNRTLSYPVGGYNDSKAVQVTITNYTSGDAKWYSDDIPVTAGKQYEISDVVQSDTESYITLRFRKNDGTFTYRDVLVLPPQKTFTPVSANFTVPPQVTSVSIFHLIKSEGVLITDNYSLREVIPQTSDNNLIPNSDFEQTNQDGSKPLSWGKGGYGTNDRTYTYPVPGVSGGNAARVQISNYTNGDAKWYHELIPVQAGTYTYTDSYMADVNSYLTVQFRYPDGTYSYRDIAVLPPSSSDYSTYTTDFSVHDEVESVRVFHLINTAGSLTIDDVKLSKKDSSNNIFTTGAVTLSFDDGWRAHRDVAMPVLQQHNLTGTFYIITQQTPENGFTGFVDETDVREIYQAGNEIGAHTRTHRALTTLSAGEQYDEIFGSREDLLAYNVGPITTFSYPFGDFDNGVIGYVEDANYDAARSTLDGTVRQTTDLYQLPRFSVESHVTLANVKAAIDDAIAQKQWIILVFHRIDNSGERYSTTPAMFGQIVEYTASKDVPVVTVAEGVARM